MEFYFAPMEGITKYIYRRAFSECFSGITKFYTPFLSPNEHRAINPKEKRDILPENNPGMVTIPQVLTNKSEFFNRTAHELKETYGYNEVNINLGCPSGTVVSKGKGAGFLARTEELHRFLEEIFAKPEVNISIKTRLGMTDPEEFYDLHPMFNEYPLHELIIHPRIQKEGYRGAPHRDIFADAVRDSKNPLCYNGDIRTVEDYQRMCEEFPTVNRVMIGRGLLSNPMLVEWIREAETAEGVEKQGVAQGSIPEGEALAQNGVRILTQNERARLKNFHDKLYASYRAEIEGDINVLFKMKEFWAYFGAQFPEKEKCLKQIRKAGRLSEYEAAVRGIL